MPCPDTLRSNVLVPMWEETQNAIQRILDPINNIAFTTDAWTSIGEHSYITVTCHVIDSKFKIHSFALETFEMKSTHTSENLLNAIKNVLSDWKLSEKHITFVSDNASDIKHALKDLGNFDWLGCTAHNLNLVVKKATKVHEAHDLVVRCKSVLLVGGHV